MSWITLERLLPLSSDILGALTLIGPRRHHLHLPPNLLLHLLLNILQGSSFLLALIYRASAWLFFLAY
jgi:hypothetical protein